MASSKPLVISLLGPTASGKTSLAIELADKLNLRLHNVDSRQVYIGMDIGTAKPTPAQRKRVKHFLIDLRQPNNPITLKEFQKTAEESLKQDLKQNKIGFLVGGSGLYLKAITHGLKPPEVPPQETVRQQLQSLGQTTCYQLLQASDQNASLRISPADTIRTQRALEVIYATGKPISEQQNSIKPPWRILEIGLDPTDLYERIFKRTCFLYENGLIEETENLSNQFGSNLPMLQTIGYKESLDVINGKLNIDSAIKQTTKRTQQLAKRQRTWFRRQHDPKWLKQEKPFQEALSLIQSVLGC